MFTSAKITLKLLTRTSVIISILTLFSTSLLEAKGLTDTLAFDQTFSDTVLLDTTMADSVNADTNIYKPAKPKKKQVVDVPVFYSSKDSMSIIVDEQTVMLWGGGKIEYQDIELTADYIVSDLGKQEISAFGTEDTVGNYSGLPVFKNKSEEFETDSIYYNLKSGKGLIYNVKTEQGEGHLHSDLTKRNDQGHIHMRGGKYTTCDEDHPHFYMELTKAIAIPNDKIISGPAYLVVEDVPVPLLGIPFGFFPSTSKRGAGVIIPKYGEEVRRGFYLRDGGWYQPLGQYMDMQILGDWYSKGSWAVNWAANYKVRYKFSGNTKIDYNVNKDNSDATFLESKDFKWTWSHRQDPKANPTQTFSANVNFSSSGYDKSNSYNHSEVVTNQKSSSISFTKNFPGTPFNLSLSANARQNTKDSTLAMDLPKGSFNATTVYPFRKKGGSGKLKWYENVGLSYKSQFANNMFMRDTMLFERSTWENLNYGFQHSVPLSINLKSEKFKMLTITPSLSYKGVMNSFHIKKRTEHVNNETEIVTDTVFMNTYAHAINPGISFGLTPKVTGMYLNTRTDPKVIAVRHVMQPRASFSYVPDMSKINPNYYDTVYYTENGELRYQTYSYFDKSLYKAPSYSGQSGSLSLGLNNNLEMKVRPKTDTIEDAEAQKVVLLRNLNLSTSYNPYAQQYKWSDVNLSASTALFKNKLNLNLTSKFSPYDLTSDTSSSGKITYKKVDEFYYDNGKGLVRFTNLSFSASITLKSKQKKGEGNTGATPERNPFDPEYRDPLDMEYDEFDPSQSLGNYVDFSVPWSLSLRYNYSLSRPTVKEEQRIVNTLNFNGDFSLTPKWKIGFNSGYDFEKKEITMTNFNIHRDLHCWEMRFTMTPFGTRQNYSFYINAKSAMLRDLKYDKRESWYDNL